MFAYAAAADAARSLLARVNEVILFPFISLLMAVALLLFLYGCFEFVINADSPGGRTQGRTHILWGIIGMLVMVSAMGILSIAAGTFGIDVPEL